MIRKDIKNWQYVILGALILLTAVLISINRPEISSASLTRPDGSIRAIPLPFNEGQQENGLYVYKFSLRNTFIFSGKLQIIQDDCLENILVNNMNLPETFFKNNCDLKNGQYVNIKKFLNPGFNTIEVIVQNKQGSQGLRVIDNDFYEKYLIIAVLFSLISLVDFKWVYKGLNMKIGTFFQVNRLSALLFISILVFSVIVVNLTLPLANNQARNISVFLLLFLTITAPAFIYIKTNFIFAKSTLILFSCALMIGLISLYKIPYDRYTHDIFGHLEYIRYLIEHNEPPIPTGGWMFYHPSFYYRFCALIFKFTNPTGDLSDAAIGPFYQKLSFLIFTLYSFFSLATLNSVFTAIKNKYGDDIKHVYILAISLFLFWTANSIVSVRIGNDILLNLLYSISFLLILKWWKSGSTFYFLMAILLCSLSVWTKTNGFIIFFTFGILIFIRFHQLFSKRALTDLYRQMIFTFIVIGSLTAYLSFYQKLSPDVAGTNTRLIVGNTDGLGDRFIVDNSIKSFLVLNPVEFVKIPFTNPVDDHKGRNHFWFYLLKSSLFGEYGHDPLIIQTVSKVLSFLYLILMMAFPVGAFALFKYLKHDAVPIIVSFSMLILLMIIFRIYYPYSTSGDFRYIYPATLPFIVCVSCTLLWLKKRKFLAFVFEISAFGFVLTSILFQMLVIFNL
jgi:hypothetical protein